MAKIKSFKVENLAAVESGKDVEIEYLGSLLWMTISNKVTVSTEDLEKELEQMGLAQYKPRRINPRDAFRRATRDVEVKREKHGEGTYVNLLVRPVRSTEGNMVRQLVREVVDGKNTRLEYKPVLQFEIKDGDHYSVTSLVPDLYPPEKQAMENVGTLYNEAINNYEGDHIRRLIDRILNACSPISVRPSGGVHFVPHKHANEMEALKKLVKNLAAYDRGTGTTRAWSVPVIDAQEHREMVEESLEMQVMSGSVKMIEDMKNALKDKGQEIQPSTIKEYAYQIKKMKNLVGEYEESLEYQATKARENLELAQQLAMKLMEKAE